MSKKVHVENARGDRAVVADDTPYTDAFPFTTEEKAAPIPQA
jgi:hypothetical protein